MNTRILGVALAVAIVAGARAQMSVTQNAQTNVPIPASGTGGASGGVSNPANVASASLNFQTTMMVERVRVGVDVVHAAVGDLRIEVSHCGTTVVVYDRSPASLADLNGVYGFDDNAGTTFSAIINSTPANGTLPQGNYAPVGSLAPFSGKSSAGDWTVTIYDLASGSTGFLLGLSITVYGGTLYAGAGGTITIPDGGQSGLCLAPVTKVVNVGLHGDVDSVDVMVPLTHTFVSDLDVTIHHAGVSVTLSEYAAPLSSGDLNGSYTFSDAAVNSWTLTETQYTGTNVIPTGSYRPKEPLAAFKGVDMFGPWYVSVCDRAGGDVGLLGTPTIVPVRSPYGYTISQPNGSASVVLTNTGGTPGHVFADLFTLAAGNAPAGWLGGLDISMADLLAEVTFGPPFVGTFGACGSNTFVVAGPIPSNLPVWTVSLEVAADGSLTAIKRVQSFVTQ